MFQPLLSFGHRPKAPARVELERAQEPAAQRCRQQLPAAKHGRFPCRRQQLGDPAPALGAMRGFELEIGGFLARGREVLLGHQELRLELGPIGARRHPHRFAEPRELDFDRPQPLFATRIRGADVRYHYAAANDGQRFLVNTVVEDVPGTPINVWVDWLSGVRRGTDD